MTTDEKIIENGKMGEHDDLSEISIEQLKSTIERELITYNERLEDNRRAKDNYEKQWRIEEKIYEIRLEGDNYRKVNSDFAYEDVPGYWDLVKQIAAYKFREEKHIAEQRLEDYDRQYDILKERIADREAQLAEMVAAMEDEE